MSALLQVYRYTEASALQAQPGNAPCLRLATTADALGQVPHFFEGRLRRPRLFADLLSAVHLVVGARFFTPPNTLARAVRLADPIVTAGESMLRFEAFSSCCSTYVRADLLPEGYDGEVVGRGTTNVDFTAAMKAALAGVRDEAGLALAVGRDGVTLRSGEHDAFERRVPLPTRWLRGLVEVQAYLADMKPCLEATGTEALRFLRTLPKAATHRTPLWIARSAAGLHTLTRPAESSVRVTDTSRLRVLEPLLARATRLTVHADAAQQANAWVLDFPGARLTLVLSAETWRGFSGEGQALHALLRAAQGTGASALAAVRAALHWQSGIDAAALARTLALPAGSVEDALRVLGASGLVGYDLALQRYFHRELPFDLGAAEDLHPRLADARALIDAGAVRMLHKTPVEAEVTSGDALHRVAEREGQWHCTCPWFARHQGERGPCKHVLAVCALQTQAP